MNYSNSYKSKQLLALVIKLFIVIACGYFIYDKIFTNQQQSFSDFLSILLKNAIFSLKNCTFLLVFSFFNWFFEIKKWHLLANKLQNISFFEAAKQSLASLTASLITPNRIGEYGAKAIYFKKSFSKKIVTLNLVGNFSQLLITIVFGLIGCIYLFFNFTIDFEATKLIYILIFGILLFTFLWFIDKKEELQKYIHENWELDKNLKTKDRIKRQLPIYEKLKNRVWYLFFQMGYSELNEGNNLKIRIEQKGEDVSEEQIDVLARDEETVIITKCKASGGFYAPNFTVGNGR